MCVYVVPKSRLYPISLNLPINYSTSGIIVLFFKLALEFSNQSIKLLIQFVFTIYKAVRPFKTFEHGELANAITWLNDKDDKGELDNFDVSSEGMDDELKNNLIKQQFHLK